MTEPVNILSKHFGAWGKDDPTPAPVAVTFRFAVNQRVRWHGTIHGTFRVAWRQWHEGQSSTWITYGLCRDDDPMVWTAYEPDLTAIGEGTP